LSVLCNKEYDDDDDDDDDDDYVNTHTRFQCELQNVNVAWILTLIPARRGGGKINPTADFAENRLPSNGMRQLFL